MNPLFSAWIILLSVYLIPSCGRNELCACKKKYRDSIQKKANDKEPAPTLENQSENKELKECVTLWKNATVSEQREMVANTKKCP